MTAQLIILLKSLKNISQTIEYRFFQKKTKVKELQEILPLKRRKVKLFYILIQMIGLKKMHFRKYTKNLAKTILIYYFLMRINFLKKQDKKMNTDILIHIF